MLATSLVAVLIAACGAPGGGGGGGPGAASITGGTGTVKVALLLPMTAPGSTPAVAKALKQAAELALFDFDNPGVTLVPKDTKGTPEGARAAAESAVQEGAELIIGPLFAQEVTGAAPRNPPGRYPDDRLLQRREGRRQRRLSVELPRRPRRAAHRRFALARGKRNFAVLVPETPYGRIAEAAFAKAVARAGGQASVRATYPPNDPNAMIGPVRQIANAIKSGQQIDALFLPAGREELPSLAPLLASSDVTSTRVQFVGTGQWDYPSIGNEKALIGGWYPAPDPKGWNGFTERYSKTYGDTPPRLASLAYDAVSLAVSLSQNPPGQRYTPALLTRGSGFNGIDGLFRLLPDGTTERGLAILEVREGGPQVLEPAPNTFVNAQY